MFNASAILLAANELGKQKADLGGILQTVGLGIGTVFLGLICIIILCKIMSFVVSKLPSANKTEAAPAPAPAVASAPASIENRGALSAAIAAAVAEEMGTDVSGIRIVSIKRK